MKNSKVVDISELKWQKEERHVQHMAQEIYNLFQRDIKNSSDMFNFGLRLIACSLYFLENAMKGLKKDEKIKCLRCVDDMLRAIRKDLR